jgi:hypothetical protein
MAMGLTHIRDPVKAFSFVSVFSLLCFLSLWGEARKGSWQVCGFPVI